MAINFNLNTDKAVGNLQKLDQSLSRTLSKLKALDANLKSISSDKAAKKVDALRGAMKGVTTSTSSASKELSTQGDITKKLKSEVNNLNSQLKSLSTSQKTGKKNSLDLTKLTQEELEKKVRLSNENKRLTATVKTLGNVKQEELLKAQAILSSSNKRINQLRQETATTNDNTSAKNKARKSSQDLSKLTQEELDKKIRLSNENKRLTATTKTLGNVKQEELLKAQAVLRASNKRITQLQQETAATNTNTNAKRKAIVASKVLNTTIADGNQKAAAFRAGLAALGAHFGIFTGSTIVAAASVFAFIKSFKEAITAAAQFDFAMDRAEAVMGANVIQSSQLRNEVRSLAETTIFTAREVSEGLIFLGMAGQSVNESLLSLEPTLRLAQIGMIDMKTAADLVTNIMAAFNIGAEGLSDTVDLLSTVVTRSNTSITQLAQAISFVGPAAQATGTSLQHTAVLLGFFADNGVKASRAGTALRRGIANLAAPTDRIKKALFDLGITAIDPTTGLMKSMIVIIRELRESGADLRDVFDIFGKRAGPAFAAAILGDSSALEDLLEKTNNVTGATGKLIARLEDNQVSEFKKALAAGEEALIAFGEILSGVVNPTIAGLATALKGISGFLKENETLVKALGAALSALLVVKLVSVFGTWILATQGVVFATKTLIPSLLGVTSSIGPIMPASIAASRGLTMLKLSFATLFGSISALVAVGVAVYLSVTGDEAEKAAKKLEPLIDNMGRLNKVVSLLGDNKNLAKGLEDHSDELLTLMDRIKRSQEDFGDRRSKTIGEIISTGMEEANRQLREAKDNLREVNKGTNLIGRNLNLVNRPSSDKSIQEAKDNVAFIQNQLDLHEEALALAKKRGDQNKTELERQREITQELEKQKQIAIKKHALEVRMSAISKFLLVESQVFTAEHGIDPDAVFKEGISRLEKDKALLDLRLQFEQKNNQEITKLLKDNLDERTALYVTQFGIVEAHSEAFTKEFRLKMGKKLLVTDEQVAEAADNIARSLGISDVDKIDDFITALKEMVTKRKAIGNEQIALQIQISDALTKTQIDQRKRDLKSSFESDRDELKLQMESFNTLRNVYRNQFNIRSSDIKSFIEAERKISLDEHKLTNDLLISQINDLNKEIKKSEDRSVKAGEIGDLGSYKKEQTLLRELEGSTRKLEKARSDNTKEFNLSIIATENFVKSQGKDLVDSIRDTVTQMEERNAVMRIAIIEEKSMAVAAIDLAIASLRASTATGKLAEANSELIEELQRLRPAMEEAEEAAKKLENTWDSVSNNMEGRGKQAALSLQDAFVDYFIDPTSDSFDDLLKSFAAMITKMVAENAIKDIFNNGVGKEFVTFFDRLTGNSSTDETTTSSSVGGDNSLTGVAGSLLEVSDHLTSNAEVEALNNENLMSSIEAFDFSTERMSNWTTFANEATNLEMENSNLGLGNVITGAFASKGAAATLTSAAGVLTSSAGNITVASTRLGLSADALTSAASALLAAANSSSGGGSGGILAVFGGDKALGGPVKKDKAYLVGEVGRELFIPDTDGRIVPNSKIPKRDVGGGGDVTFNNTINVYSKGSDKAEIRQMVKQGMIELEVKITRQQQRSQRTAGRR